MNSMEYLLTQAASECNEVAHRITKAMHFGLSEIEPGQHETNSQRIVAEYVDLVAVMKMLEEAGHVSMPDPVQMSTLVRAKQDKVLTFMRFARNECGTLSDAEAR